MELAYLKGQVFIFVPLKLLSQLLVLFNALLLESFKGALYRDDCLLLLSVDEVGLLLCDVGVFDEFEGALVFILKELYILKLVHQLALNRWDLTFWLSAYW